MKITTCIFDFDGTLVDSHEDVLSSLSYAFESCKVPARPGDADIIMQHQLSEVIETMAPGISDEVRSLVMRRFREHYDACGFPTTRLLPTVAEGLAALQAKSIPCYIVSNKRRIPMEKLLKKLAIRNYFEGIYNPDMYDEEKKMSKIALLAHALDKHHLKKESTAYVGDMEIDVAAAKANGLIAVSVKNGYGKSERFKVKPDIEIDRIADLVELL
jgi:phosphoglycolate phosphatase